MIRSTFQASCAGSLTKIGSRLIVRRTRRHTLVLGAALPAQFEDQHAWIDQGDRPGVPSAQWRVRGFSAAAVR